ncbi:unnamed protein product [Cladocopium goreaui]|uniref:C3H1-type domain-containing protein n=1 Tax=Cladocopium goreaui TaxID=2562237 RepID=A0A9P1CTB9_9DINO|nr:unnamed protein product [Cladocopium goreaui]
MQQIRMADAVKYEISVKNTFLEFHEVQEEPLSMRKSQSCGSIKLGSGLSNVPSTVEDCQASEEGHLPLVGQDAEICNVKECKPCVYFMSQHGCDRSPCGFCHLQHASSKTRRPRKKQRDSFKA